MFGVRECGGYATSVTADGDTRFDLQLGRDNRGDISAHAHPKRISMFRTGYRWLSVRDTVAESSPRGLRGRRVDMKIG